MSIPAAELPLCPRLGDAQNIVVDAAVLVVLEIANGASLRMLVCRLLGIIDRAIIGDDQLDPAPELLDRGHHEIKASAQMFEPVVGRDGDE
jgi:hypothetical protein